MKKCCLFVLVIATILAGCGRQSPERSSHTEIVTKAGKSLYVNRLVRGNNYDAVWITTSSGPCRTPSDADVMLGKTYDSSELYYKSIPDGSIVLFLPWGITIPKEFASVIKYEEIHPLDWVKLKDRYAKGEISRLKLDLPKSDPCTFRWTEIRDLFRRDVKNENAD